MVVHFLFCGQAFPVKLCYNIDDGSFSYHTTAESLSWQPLVLTEGQKDVMFQWLEKERYELFNKLVLQC